MVGECSKTRHTRTRTGCLKCRVRRRKCDENKPTCGRCLEGQFDCRYGVRLSFLEKNTTISESLPRVLQSNYDQLQFIAPGSVTQKKNIQLPDENLCVANPIDTDARTTTKVSVYDDATKKRPEPTELIRLFINSLEKPSQPIDKLGMSQRLRNSTGNPTPQTRDTKPPEANNLC
ncbi:hypothetical protein B0J13DRAFT_560253 [Dactylonectria estremocensis]|uniref:Zn(2)-C6 fungal-type domain-containing protein n=1 Tax=Dactylonectria estremocensis TaxID=1079267 RepID=A0A9P9EFX3_9HYPO|nr:hypothetical protein B0J13DRAFT_560253 [Dactylonectria estremocensis]